jgi:hypothetical protein
MRQLHNAGLSVEPSAGQEFKHPAAAQTTTARNAQWGSLGTGFFPSVL